MQSKDLQPKLINIIRREGPASVAQLVTEKTSPETIRRNLSALSRSGSSRETSGEMVILQLECFYEWHAILTIVDAYEIGATKYNVGESSVTRVVLSCADDSNLLTDSSKPGCNAPFAIGGLDKFDQLVYEAGFDAPHTEALNKANTQAIY